jgi:hypothetical protein
VGSGAHAADEIHLVDVGDGEEQPGALDPGTLQHGWARPTPLDYRDVDVVGDVLQPVGLDIDDDDVVLQVGQALGDVIPHLTGAHDHDVHGSLSGNKRRSN